MEALAVKKLVKHFGGIQVLHDVSFAIEAGERRAIIGPNGAGKTTLFNIICGQLRPTSGQVSLFGRDVTRLAPHKRAMLSLARTFQITSLFSRLTVMENLMLAVQALDRVKSVMYRPAFTYGHIMERTHSLLKQWNLWERRNTLVQNLSYGDQRQIEIMMALAGRPKLLLLDEPTSGLAAVETQQVTSLIRNLDPDITVLLIEHDMDVAFQIATWVTVLCRGQVLTDGPPEMVRKDEQVLELYLGKKQIAQK